MKKRFMHLLALPVLVLPLLTGCNSDKDEPTPQEPTICPQEPPFKQITETEAAKIAGEALVDFGFITTSQLENAEYTFESVERNNKTVYYLVNYKNAGYVAINPNFLSPAKVLAVSGQQPPAEYILTENMPEMSAPVEGKPAGTPDGVFRKYAFTTPVWNRFLPYSQYCPKKFDEPCLGTQPVAIGEVLAYYKQPVIVDGKPFDWNGIDSYSPDASDIDAIARLLGQIGVDMDCMDYYLRKNQFNIPFADITKLIRSYGLNWVYLKGMDALLGSGEMTKGPVIVSIPNYTLVADALVNYSSGDTYATYLHYNFGWEGYDNAYYLVNAYTYDKETDMTTAVEMPGLDKYEFIAVSR